MHSILHLWYPEVSLKPYFMKYLWENTHPYIAHMLRQPSQNQQQSMHEAQLISEQGRHSLLESEKKYWENEVLGKELLKEVLMWRLFFKRLFFLPAHVHNPHGCYVWISLSN